MTLTKRLCVCVCVCGCVLVPLCFPSKISPILFQKTAPFSSTLTLTWHPSGAGSCVRRKLDLTADETPQLSVTGRGVGGGGGGGGDEEKDKEVSA